MNSDRIHDGFKTLGISFRDYEFPQPSADTNQCAFKQYSVLEEGNVFYSDSMRKEPLKK